MEAVVDIFHRNRKAYGTRKIKVKLLERGGVSTYTVAQYKPHQAAANEKRRAHTLNREFAQTEVTRMIVSDLTYVRVQNQWHYICVRVDWFHREVIRDRVGAHKDATLVSRAFATVTGDLHQIQWFHTDRGSECNHQKMDQLLQTFKIGPSLSMKGCSRSNL